MKPGAIVLTVIPQDDQQKKRPVLILKTLPKYNDFLVCAISSQLRQFIPDFDLIIKDNHPEFSGTGLRTSSLIRLANPGASGITGCGCYFAWQQGQPAF